MDAPLSTRMAVRAIDVRNNDVLINSDFKAFVIDHSEHDCDVNDEPMVLLVPRGGKDHTGFWHYRNAVVNIDRPLRHSFD